ncbi:MAG: hypothetical protein N2691_02375 [Patescibacteria group bacterium]|nr:hypothetical protein [Patescibacteria group bacterium]
MSSITLSRSSFVLVLVVVCMLLVVAPVAAQVRRPVQVIPTATVPPVPNVGTTQATESARRQLTASPTPTPPVAATWEFIHNPAKNTFTLNFDWLSIPGTAGYAVAITQNEDDWHPEKVVTIRSGRIFPNLRSGVYYVHVAALLKTGEWSPIYTWHTVTPIVLTPSPTPVVSPDPDPAEVLGIRSRVEEIINALQSGNISAFTAGPGPEDEPFAVPDIPAIPGMGGSRTEPNRTELNRKQRFTCNCDKTCKTIYSCSEAYFQLNACNCAHLDADQDGVPCENKCGDE